jgi:FixJ family two-component response regulator
VTEPSPHAPRKIVALGVRDEGVRAAIAFALEANGYATCPCPVTDDDTRPWSLGAEAACMVLDCEGRGRDFPMGLARWWGIDLDRPIIVLASAPGLPLMRTCVELGAQLIEKPLLGTTLLTAIANVPGLDAAD